MSGESLQVVARKREGSRNMPLGIKFTTKCMLTSLAQIHDAMASGQRHTGSCNKLLQRHIDRPKGHELCRCSAHVMVNSLPLRSPTVLRIS